MLGPLPKLYRIAVGASALLLFVGAGAWAALMLPYPVLVISGASVGLALGVLCTYLLLHAETPSAQPVVHHTSRHHPRHAARHRLG